MSKWHKSCFIKDKKLCAGCLTDYQGPVLFINDWVRPVVIDGSYISFWRCF